MDQFILISLVHCLIFTWCSGGMVNYSGLEGDPAPGRSPGPPLLTAHTIPGLSGNSLNLPCGFGNETEVLDNGVLNLTITHRLFKSDVLSPGVEYQVTVSRIQQTPAIDFLITSSIDQVLSGEFTTPQETGCGPHIFRSQLKTDQLKLNWTFEGSSELGESNFTFQLLYKIVGYKGVFRKSISIPAVQECSLDLLEDENTLTSEDIPRVPNCRVWFPSRSKGHGLLIELTRLNVPCSKGYVHFSGLNVTQRQHIRSHKQAHLCEKLEELPESDRHIYFPSSHITPFMQMQGSPIFALTYRLVDYCYNITFNSRNGSYELKPSGELKCTFKIYLPYGNRVALNLQIGDSTSTGSPETGLTFQDLKTGAAPCNGLLTELHDGGSIWSHCTKSGDAERQIEMVSRENRIILKVTVWGANGGALGLKMTYRAEPIETIVGMCEYGWVALRQFCVSAVEEAKLPWAQAEMECSRRGGHLASIRNEADQKLLNNLLENSPGYRNSNSYWIGASDKLHEGDFKWSDGLPLSYTNWFPGWAEHGYHNRQPNDDGLSEQDCVEIRRIYSLPGSSAADAQGFYWNDRDCSTPNFFLCEKLQNDEPLEENWPPDCNRSVVLSRQQPKATVSSPGFPRQYPDNANCDTTITAPPGYRITLDFEELVLESEPTCGYDFLQIIEIFSNGTSNATKRLCGDWSSKLKLLRYVSTGSKMKLRFTSDYSHHYGGFKARASMESTMQCADDRLQMFNNSCYLIVSYPEVTWNTAQQICRGMKANLASILNAEEERFITTTIRKASEYRTSALYWLGGKLEHNVLEWIDGNPMEYSGWLPGQKLNPRNNDINCIGLQWIPSPTPLHPSGLYWKSKKCSSTGGYVCKRRNQLLNLDLNLNRTLNGSAGTVTSPNHPGNYYNNLDFSIKISGPERTRLVISFEKLDIEPQRECLYDYIELKSIFRDRTRNGAVRYCGNHEYDMDKFNFVSETNEAEVNFHSDYSIAGSGFKFNWKAVDVSSCPSLTLTAAEGVITSPNYPDFLLPHLDCTITILASSNKRVWLDFDVSNSEEIEVNKNSESILELSLGEQFPFFKPLESEGLLTEGSYVSSEDKLVIRLRTGDSPRGKGIKANYKVFAPIVKQKTVMLNNYSSGSIFHLNYPDIPPANIDFLQYFVAPLGYIISLELFFVKVSDGTCDGILEVVDNYSDGNGTVLKLCYDSKAQDAPVPAPPFAITSFFNTLHLRQNSNMLGVPLNGSLKVLEDLEFRSKVLNYKEERVETCHPNPCHNRGKCVKKKMHRHCQCLGHFTGVFCALTQCDLEPCVFGTCELTESSFKCHCKKGYVGPMCEQKKRPCEGNPCESRGTCIEKGDSFTCRCHAWWEGPRCEKRMMHIPYKPLSERMLHEPFWLGLMTVFVVMGVIGLVWCAKRHFPEKIEKLLAEESERNRSTMSSLRSASVREQLAAASGAAPPQVAASPGPGAPRSLFGRLGIRKPSILSLTSPHASGYVPATARTFSLDDLLKPPPRLKSNGGSEAQLVEFFMCRRNGTPSPKKKRNNSTPTKKNVAEKKQILQQLISPGSKQGSRKVSVGELIQMTERNPQESNQERQEGLTESKFIESDPVQYALNDPKLEKKVTFARLLNKVSAEMSSGSDMEMGIMQSNRLGCMFVRPSSTPPSPSTDARSPNSTSSNQGSDSMTSSDFAMPCALSSSISDLLNSRRHSRLPNGRQKPASADSILAMFRNFSSSSAGVNLPPSLKVSPSTTPTASSPQDDIAGDDESSTSSIHTPVSFSSGPPESPVMHRMNQPSTIEVPVLDPLNAHKSTNSGSNFLHPPTILLEIPSTINKCLSPIREMPTPLPSPMPSPALTPIMRRSNASSSLEDAEMSDDRISVELPNISISCSDLDEDEMHCSDIAIDPQAEDGLILEEAAAMHSASLRTKNRPSPIGQSIKEEIKITIEPPPLVIPTLIVQTPSPTHTKSPSLLFPGSPPPRSPPSQECFQFPPAHTKQRRLYKEFDKPTSLDLPCAPPMITITCNMSEAESDVESISPAIKHVGHCPVSAGMSYLSPFSMVARGDHNASESNLSSSGYSSMASPGPSRCGSSNPLCPSEMEDPGSGGCHRRLSLTPVLKPANNSETSSNRINEVQERRGRSDSETLSDDPLLESNDEGIGTDHIDEKIEEGELKSAKELEVFMTVDESKSLLDLPLIPELSSPRIAKCSSLEESGANNKNSLQLPSIIIQCESPGEKRLSPMSSRSESPLSDRTLGVGRFSPQFYGRNKDLLPFTDSDGLYDFPSSDKVNIATTTHHKKTGRKREKKASRNCKTPSPTKTHPIISNQLDIPLKESYYKVPPPRKLSPKRRITRSKVVTSSSSSDSINSARELRLSSSSPSPDTIRWSSPAGWLDENKPKQEERESGALAKPADFFKVKSKGQKVSRLRAISHQIRFLRRLELSLKRRERTISPSDSLDSGEESPRATSPLLQPSKYPKVEIKKSNSIGKLQQYNSSASKKKGKYKKGELLLPQDEQWKKVVVAGSGHSD